MAYIFRDMKRSNRLTTAAALLLVIISGACSKEEPAPISTTTGTATPPSATNFSEHLAAAVPEPVNTNPPAVIPIQSPTNAVVATTNGVAILTPLEAKQHVGETATVRGKVFGIHISAKGDAFINVGAAYPDAPFTAVCFHGSIPTNDLQKLDGKMVSFTGPLKDYNGQTEVVLDNAGQIAE